MSNYGLIYGSPRALPEPPVQRWPGVKHRWIGVDGSEWDLSNPDGGVFLGRGVRGLNMPEYDVYTSSSPAVEGSRHLGSKARPRQVGWPLAIFSDRGSEGWLDLDSAFFRSMDVDRPGIWEVTRPNGTRRMLRLQYVSDGGITHEIDPAVTGWVVYPLTLVANDPYWFGPQVVRRFGSSEAIPFFGAGGFGPPFYISRGSSISKASIPNPGDVPAYLTIWVENSTTAQIGVGSRLIDIPFAVEEGRMLVVNTAPANRTAKEIDAPPAGLSFEERSALVDERLRTDSTDRTAELGDSTRWTKVPPGGSVNLTVNVVGQPIVTVFLTPRYRRAW